MKRFVALAAALVVSSVARAEEEAPLLIRSTGGGFAPIEHIRSQSCEIFADRIVVRNHIGFETSETVKPFTLDVRKVRRAIERAAARGTTDLGPAPLDAPIQFYAAQHPQGSEHTITLRGVCGDRICRNDAPAARWLRDLLDTQCGEGMGGL